jgi:hypothetical protein
LGSGVERNIEWKCAWIMRNGMDFEKSCCID